jgi:hypothetical protein
VFFVREFAAVESSLQLHLDVLRRNRRLGLRRRRNRTQKIRIKMNPETKPKTTNFMLDQVAFLLEESLEILTLSSRQFSEAVEEIRCWNFPAKLTTKPWLNSPLR